MREKEELVRLIDLFLLVDSNFDKTTATRNALRQLKHAISMNRKKEIQRLIRDELQAMLAKIANQSKDDLPLVNNLSSSDVADMLLCTFAKLLPLNVLENNYPIDIISMEKILNQDRFVSSTGYLFTLSHLAHYQCELAKGKKVIKHFVDPLINSPFLSARDEARLWLMLSKLKPKTKAKVKHQALSRIFRLTPQHNAYLSRYLRAEYALEKAIQVASESQVSEAGQVKHWVEAYEQAMQSDKLAIKNFEDHFNLREKIFNFPGCAFILHSFFLTAGLCFFGWFGEQLKIPVRQEPCVADIFMQYQLYFIQVALSYIVSVPAHPDLYNHDDIPHKNLYAFLLVLQGFMVLNRPVGVVLSYSLALNMSELALDNIREYYIASSRQTALVDKAVRSCPNHALINRQRPTAPGIFGFYSKIEHLTRSASQKHTPTREKARSLRVR